MINVLFFAQVRELLGTAKLSLEANEQTQTAEALRATLAATDDKWAKVLSSDKLLVAVNQTISQWDTPVNDGDEVAFFPPVTGG
ncbi:MAG: molybdopterin synthase sulfur carrier subunit [Gammaproteobacteria bacterium]|jgi:sulfur-carrier protein|nr:molybdopterin synthase sulfur carrier subunit [Gammaproteobacteria bacterium]QYX65055.1 molybdopterin synthase sulfur carrier subunit [Shewanella putrefaciens]MBU1477246.1 molybdopterin synthase sulfur carrier subunit [Gammaproteobacteria bacterium]MBU2001011.1 molybdopterin synthase sulfur carrier subunit [Gammaproteobacteria bacterium]MBU2131941.1 molybdopterin synthase sulfur carrier subunit [Gammaproteobacteria bacterium]